MSKMTDSERDNKIRSIEASIRKMSVAMCDISMSLKQIVALKTLETMYDRDILTGVDYDKYLQDILEPVDFNIYDIRKTEKV